MNEWMQERRLQAIRRIGLITAVLTALFWGIWSLFASVPVMYEVLLANGEVLHPPFPIPFGGYILTIPLWAILLTWLFTSKVTREERGLRNALCAGLGVGLIVGLIATLAGLAVGLAVIAIVSLGVGVSLSLNPDLGIGLGFVGLGICLGFGLGAELIGPGVGLVAGLGLALIVGLVAGLIASLGGALKFFFSRSFWKKISAWLTAGNAS